jgi:O-antigen/teichoic acid export membrane protein
MNNTINIGRKDVLWNYAATFLQIGVGVILLPFILRVFPQETVAIWTIFTTIIALAGLLDFGFNPSFARNVSYVVSGVKELKATGYNIVESSNSEVDYSLFKGLINAMKWFYARAAAILFVLLATAGTYYMHTVLKNYSGDHAEVYIAWVILVVINSYSLYTMYYDSLMQGKGLIKRSKQIKIIGQSAYLIAAVVLILLRFNLIAVISAQALSIVIIRILSYRTIYTAKFKQHLNNVKAQARKEILKPIYPNAVKVGLTALGGFLVIRTSTIMGSLYLSLESIASYGIAIQIIAIISSIANVYSATYQPKIVQYRTQNDIAAIKHLYLKGCLLLFGTFALGGLALILLGEWALNIIGSQTPLLSKSFMSVTLLIYLLETNHINAGGILVTKNEVPFFKASLFSGALTVILLLVFLNYTNLGVWGLILAQGMAQGCYQNWKWPREVIKELYVKRSDIHECLRRVNIIKKPDYRNFQEGI